MLEDLPESPPEHLYRRIFDGNLVLELHSNTVGGAPNGAGLTTAGLQQERQSHLAALLDLKRQ
jgi:hypothetical protein